MRLRNGKIIIDIERKLFENLEYFKKEKWIIINNHNRYHFVGFYREIPDFYNFINSNFNKIHDLLLKNKKYKNHDCFLDTILFIQKVGKKIFGINEGRCTLQTSKNEISQLIKNVNKKIENYKKTYKKEINNVFCKLLNKLNCDIINHINSYLICM